VSRTIGVFDLYPLTMSHFQTVKLEHASRLLNHGPTILVTSAAGSRRNVMAAADTRVFAHGHWTFDASNADLHTLHHLGAGNFTTASTMIAAKPLKAADRE
jgi:hypothetical protein